eukprot:4566160-Pyramimonas_sp.AAC.1
MTELAGEGFSHWGASTCASSKIDRCFTSAPPWLLCQAHRSARFALEPRGGFCKWTWGRRCPYCDVGPQIRVSSFASLTAPEAGVRGSA